MLALHAKLPFIASNIEELESQKRYHKGRIDSARAVIDTSRPRSLSTHRSNARSSITSRSRQEGFAKITQENLHIAKRLYKIIDTPSEVSKYIETFDQVDHLRYINNRARDNEVKAIQKENLFIASRIVNVKPSYSRRKHTQPKLNKKYRGLALDALLLKKVMQSKQMNCPRLGNIANVYTNDIIEKVTQRSETFNCGPIKISSHSIKIIVNCSIVQKGRILDCIVVSNVDSDLLIVYGVDVEDGQKYEIQISSNDAENFLNASKETEDQINWVNFLNTLSLPQVQKYSLSYSVLLSQCYKDIKRDSEGHEIDINSTIDNVISSVDMKPCKPANLPPSKSNGRAGRNIVHTPNQSCEVISPETIEGYLAPLHKEALVNIVPCIYSSSSTVPPTSPCYSSDWESEKGHPISSDNHIEGNKLEKITSIVPNETEINSPQK